MKSLTYLITILFILLGQALLVGPKVCKFNSSQGFFMCLYVLNHSVISPFAQVNSYRSCDIHDFGFLVQVEVYLSLGLQCALVLTQVSQSNHYTIVQAGTSSSLTYVDMHDEVSSCLTHQYISLLDRKILVESLMILRWNWLIYLGIDLGVLV